MVEVTQLRFAYLYRMIEQRNTQATQMDDKTIS